METKFKAVMKKNEKVLEDFILFSQRVNNPSQKFKMSVIAIGLVVIGWLARKDSMTVGIVIGGLGVLLLIYILLLRHKLSLGRLKKADQSFIEQNELTYEFTKTNIHIYKDGVLDMNVGGYSHISCLYNDEYNFYVGINNEDLLLIPRDSFVEGNQEEFIGYLERRSGEQSEFLPRTLKNRWSAYKVRRKQQDEEYNAKAAKRREEDKKKKEERKAKRNNK